MNQHYTDILSRVGMPPVWFDENAVPRFNPFLPEDISDIYAREAVLLEIACQGCARTFLVAISLNEMDRSDLSLMSADGRDLPTLAEDIRAREIEYGDPPNVNCCPSGPTMSSDAIRVVEYWKRERDGWQRDATLEVALTADG